MPRRRPASDHEAAAWAANESAALTAVIEVLPDGICLGDASGIRRCNSAAARLFGVQDAQELHADLPALVQRFRLRLERDGPLLQPAELPLARALSDGTAATLELWARQTAGQEIFLRCAAAPILAEGRVEGMVAVFSDLTERLQLRQTGRALSRAETVLQERDAELRAVVARVRDYAIYTISPEGLITSWHQGAALMKGYSAEEAIGMPFMNLFLPEDRAAGRPQLEMRVAAESGEYTGEGQRLRKDGSVFEAAVVLTPLRGPDGDLLGFLKMTQDITERKQREREARRMLHDAQEARAEAERASRLKGEFLATISHELRTPLAAILGWAQVLERGVSEPETVQHGLAAISRNARTQVQLIEDLLDMNRIEAGQLRLDLQRMELGSVIAAAIDSALPAATAKGVGLRTVFGRSTGAVMGDPVRLQQVVANLLNNAIKFTPAGGQVSVSLTQAGSSVQIAVEDTGQGIEADFLQRLFDRFRQQDASTTRRFGGLGLGLAIARNLVLLHGGSVQAHSPGPGRGSTFTVTLPALVDNAAAADTAAPAGPDALPPERGAALPLQGLTVLLVDDEPDVRHVTAHVLEQAGALVLSAADAAQGLQRLREDRPAVILSDIAMPETDGYELIQRVRRLPAEEGGETPAAAFTAYARPEDRRRALEAGYQMHLSKPVEPGALVRIVRQLAELNTVR